MGLKLSYPFVKEPESCDDPDSDSEDFAESDQMNLSMEIHEINLKYSFNMVQQRIRSIQETAKLQGYIKDWKSTTEELQKKYPDWTSKDLLNLLHLFELFDTNGDRLFDFKEFNACMDFTMKSSTAEERMAMFETADVENYKCISFEEFLELMHRARMGSPVPAAPKTEDEHDPESQDIIANMACMDTFQQMCYNLY